MKNKIAFVFLMTLMCPFVFAQTTIRGKVIDEYSQQPLAFANVVFNNDNNLQVISDIDGRFSYTSQLALNVIKCSYTGYNTYTGNVDGKQSITITMTAAVNQLDEVTIDPGENPAYAIMRKVIANKSRNNPENLNSFQYTCYNKVIFDFLWNNAKNDSLYVNGKLKKNHLLINESVTERKYRKPNNSEELIIGTKVSGFKNPTFAALATDLQPFSFYQDYITLFDVRYLNPISQGSLKNYKFRLEDEILQEKDSVFIIAFEPKKGKNFDGLTGLLYINSNGYAIQNVIASPFEKGKIDIRIQQQYQFLEGRYWFPEQLNYLLAIPGYPTKNLGIYAEGKSYINTVSIDLPLSQNDFSALNVRLSEHAATKDSTFWNRFRNTPLTPFEKRTYTVVDSIGKAQNYDVYLTVAEKLIQGKFPLPYFDINLNKTLVYNQYEGLRLGLGLSTNDALSKKFSVGGFFGYGLKDERWKYGGNIDYEISMRHAVKIGFSYQDNLMEIGNYGLQSYENNFYNLRNLIGYRYDRIQQKSIRLQFRNLRFAQWIVSLSQTDVAPQYDYEYVSLNGNFAKYKNANLSIRLRYAFAEKQISSFGNTFSGGTKYPVFYFLISKGFKNVGNGDFDYIKMEVAAEQAVYFRNFGSTKYRIEGGYINKSLPLGLLFTGEGSSDNDYPFLMKNHFQTMKPYEFLSDQYATLFLAHNFGTLLIKNKFMQPNIVLINNIGWGTLSARDRHAFSNFNTKENTYLETGLKLDNLIKLNYLNLGYLGVGVAGFYRYGYYATPDFEDNLAIKMTANFTIK